MTPFVEINKYFGNAKYILTIVRKSVIIYSVRLLYTIKNNLSIAFL